MSKKSEKVVQKDIIDYLEGKGYYVIKIVRANKIGVSDLAVCANGKYISIEVKAEGKKNDTSTMQEFHLDLVRKSGGKAIVADCIWDVIEEGGL